MKKIYFNFVVLILAVNVNAQNIDYTLSGSWSATNNEWRDNVRRTYSYENGNLAMVYSEVRYPDSLNWIPAERTQHTYNSDGKITLSLTESWNENLDVWQNSYRNLYDYTENGELLTSISEKWNSTWIPQSKNDYMYDSNAILTEKYFSHWDTISSNWLYISGRSYVYNPDGKIANEIRQRFMNDQWVSVGIMNYSYTPFGKISEISDSATDGSISGSRTRYSYDSLENLIYELSDVMNSSTHTWRPLFQFNYLNNDDGSVHSFIRQVNMGSDSVQWVNFGRLTYAYLSPNYIHSPDPLAFTLYPNPTADQVFIETDMAILPTSYRLLTAAGKLMKSGTFNAGRQTLSTSELADGIYLLELRSGDKTGITKFIKN